MRIFLIGMTCLTVLALFAIPGISQPPAPLFQPGFWHRIGSDFLFDISGIVFLERVDDTSNYLVCHDNKYPDEPRIGLLSTCPQSEPTYRTLEWPDSVEKPIDLESLAHFNWLTDDTTFLAMTSRGLVTHFRLDSARTRVEVLDQIQIPMTIERPNLEGMAALRVGEKILGVWGHRGSDEQPGIIFWAWYDPATGDLDMIGSREYRVPWPTFHEVRHISELKLDEAGVLYITAAAEASDDGPFAGACYIAGAFDLNDGTIEFHPNERPVRIFAFEGYKIEAFDIVPGEHGGIIFGTDNENQGAFVYYYD